jgi:hypothetical protein
MRFQRLKNATFYQICLRNRHKFVDMDASELVLGFAELWMAWLTTILRELNSTGWSLVIVTVLAMIGLGAAVVNVVPS